MSPSSGSSRTIGRVVGCVLLGVVVGLVGTGIHRLNPPVGLLLGYAAIASAAVMVRAWWGARGMLVLACAILATVGAMATVDPGGDVIVAQGAVGYAWLAGVVVVALVGLLPRRMFSNEPVTRRGRADARP